MKRAARTFCTVLYVRGRGLRLRSRREKNVEHKKIERTRKTTTQLFSMLVRNTCYRYDDVLVFSSHLISSHLLPVLPSSFFLCVLLIVVYCGLTLRRRRRRRRHLTSHRRVVVLHRRLTCSVLAIPFIFYSPFYSPHPISSRLTSFLIFFFLTFIGCWLVVVRHLIVCFSLSVIHSSFSLFLFLISRITY